MAVTSPQRSSGSFGSLAAIGGAAGIGIALAYLVITTLYVLAGAVPADSDGAAWLAYLDGQAGTWWSITGLSVATDILFLPVLGALVAILPTRDRVLTGIGAGLVGLFVVLDLAVTWPSYAALIEASSRYATVDDGTRQALLASATYAVSVLDSALFAVYAILVPALGILALSIVMWRSGFSRSAAGFGVATGILGTVAVVGGLVVEPLGTLAIPTSVLTLVWVLVTGLRLIGLSRGGLTS